MTKTINNFFEHGQTKFSASTVMIEGDAPRPIITHKTSGHVGPDQSFVRAQYVSPSSGKDGQLVLSVNTRLVNQKAAIRSMNNELQGISVTSTTSLDFVLGR